MNPINSINQEFARIVVEEWSEEAAIRQHEQAENDATTSIATIIRALVGWVYTRFMRRSRSIDTTLQHEPTDH